MTSVPSALLPRPSRRPGPALALFFLAPLVGEFLLGNLPLTFLPALVVLAPLYGGGALLIRETARRLRLNWSGMLVLCLTFGIIEEVFVTQSLFNPNYLGLRLLDPGYIPALGIGAWWTVFVLSLHTFWSTAVPISLMETLTPSARRTPWLGPIGVIISAIVFLFGCAMLLRMELKKGFVASPAQFGWSAAVVVALVAVAIVIGRRGGAAAAREAGTAPSWIAVLAAALVAGAVFFAMTRYRVELTASGVAVGTVALWAALGGLVVGWSRSAGWSERHRLALTAGFVLTYAWHGFVQKPSVGQAGRALDLFADILFATAAVILLVFAARRVRAEEQSGG
jgi:hypothetical protein